MQANIQQLGSGVTAVIAARAVGQITPDIGTTQGPTVYANYGESRAVNDFVNWGNAIANVAGAIRRQNSMTPLQEEIARAQALAALQPQQQQPREISPNNGNDGRIAGRTANNVVDFVSDNALPLGIVGVLFLLYKSGRK